MDDENPNPTYFDALVKRNDSQARVLDRAGAFKEMPEPETMTHCHLAIRHETVWLTFWRIDPLTNKRLIRRVTLPYDHWLLLARGTVDAHDDSEALDLHTQQEPE